METVSAKHLLMPVKVDPSDFFLAHWNMNMYRGCSHGCIYCDSRSVCYQIDRFDTIRPKRDALTLLEQDLRSRSASGIVTMGAMSDPYNPLEKELRLTRGALELLLRHGFGAAFTTKSALCARDADLLTEISRRSPVCARLTITCAEDDLCRRIEPNVSVSSERFDAVARLSAAGVYTGVWLNPLLPFLTDNWDNICTILRRTAEAGGQFVVCFFGMTLRTGNREYYFNALERDFPGVRDQYLRTFGNSYECSSPDAERLFALFRQECDHLGLAWQFRDVNKRMLRTQARQLSFFD